MDQLTYDLRRLKTGLNNYKHRKMMKVHITIMTLLPLLPVSMLAYKFLTCSSLLALEKSESGLLIQDHSDHGVSKELTNPLG